MFQISGCTGIPFFFISAWTPSGPSISRGWSTSPIDLPSLVTQIGLSAVFPDLPDILSGDISIVGSLRDREVACSASDRQGSNFESCVWRTVSSQSSHHPQEVLLAQFSLYVHKGGLKPDSFHFILSGDTGDSHLQRDKPATRLWKGGH